MPLHAARWIFVHKNHLAVLEAGAFARNSQRLEAHKKQITMPRKKASDQETLLSYPIRTRVTQKTGERLEKLQQESACQSVGEVARMILSGETILCFYRDVSLNAPMEEMACAEMVWSHSSESPHLSFSIAGVGTISVLINQLPYSNPVFQVL
ncbi:hypothetical protein HDF24_13595 [Mucilaginibacter sp. X4EP1]|uniref:hypothetical protein n=1 Tax=Mucilaginibacter sp. X4EP1 TaxID=2723092 RepID=UPI002168D2F9|nr:hypothetical protein [Mucilaginibacter sp. X4EP1]MCS3814596.1 hypothetical protein [Mucilaginibacter sp. X4EP1]